MAVAVAAFTIGVGAQGLAHVDVKDATGKSVGMVMISAKDGGVSIAIDFTGLPPGEHALHFHQTAKGEAPFTSAGGHFNPGMKKHGSENPEGPHAGDMGQLHRRGRRHGQGHHREREGHARRLRPRRVK